MTRNTWPESIYIGVHVYWIYMLWFLMNVVFFFYSSSWAFALYLIFFLFFFFGNCISWYGYFSIFLLNMFTYEIPANDAWLFRNCQYLWIPKCHIWYAYCVLVSVPGILTNPKCMFIPVIRPLLVSVDVRLLLSIP